VPAAKTVYILAAQYETDRDLVVTTIALTTAASVGTLVVRLTAMAHLLPGAFPR